MDLNESIVEEAALDWFKQLGYSIGHGPHLAPGEPATERDSFGDVILVGRLRKAIHRLNTTVPEEARAVQEPLMEHVDVLITTEEDTRVVLRIGAEGKDGYEHVDAESYAHVARSLEKRFNLRAVAVTLRENPRVWSNSWSAIVAASGQIHRAPRYEVEVVDRIGAGDAFSAGLIVSRLENTGWEDAVRFATATSALKHSIPGDFCLVTRGEVEQLLRGASLRVSR